MTLQRVNRVVVEDWRSWQGATTLSDLPAGLVVLAGPNAVGKTGLWEAIVAALLDRHWGRHTERLRPAGTKGVTPRVEVQFSASDRTWRVEKHFGGATRDRARLEEFVDGRWELSDQGEEAYLLARKAVLGDGDSAPSRGGSDRALGDTLMEVLLAPQGQLAFEAPAPEAVAVAVTDRDAADTATRVGRVLATVERQTSEIWVGQRNRPSKGTDLQVWRDRLKAIDEEIPDLERSASEISALVTRLDQAGAMLSDRDEAEARNEQAKVLREEVRAHRDARDEARRKEEEARGKKDVADRLVSDREALVKAFENAGRDLEKAQRREETATEDLLRRTEEQTLATERRDRFSAEERQLQQWIAYEKRDSQLEHLQKDLDRVQTRYAAAVQAGEDIAGLEAELGSLRLPTGEEWEEWDDLKARHSRAEGGLRAGAWAVSGDIPAGLNLTVDGEEVAGESVETFAAREVVLSDDEGSTLRMDAPRDVAEEVRALTDEIREFLGRFEVTDIAELRKRNENIQADLKQRLALVRQKQEDALGEASLTDLLREEVEIEGRMERARAGGEPGADRPEGHAEVWEIRLETLGPDLEDARNRVEADGIELGSARGRANDATDALKASRQDLEVASGALDDHRAVHGSDEQVRFDRALATEGHRALHEEWRKFEDARRMAEDAKEERADGLSAGLTEILANQREVQRLEADIEAARRGDPEVALAALEAERADLLPKLRAEETRAGALLLLERSLEAEKQRMTHAIGQPVRDLLQGWSSYLFQDDSRVFVDEHGRPSVVRTPAGREVPLDDQSFGTREQMSVLYRLAVAGLVAEESGSGVCLMLDDPFGHSDRVRRERLLDILKAEADRRGHQILLFTCRPEDFDGVGHSVTLG
ncbi:MAG: hypothetical protein ABFS86_14290 [Planctomycetota bacterium]